MRRAVCLALLVGIGCANRDESRPNPELKVPATPSGRNPDGKGGAPIQLKNKK